MSKEKVTGPQIRWTCASMLFGNSVLISFFPMILEAKQDAWISAFLGGVAGLFISFISIKISLYYPDKTFVEYVQLLFGKWIGKLLVLPYFAMCFTITPVVFRQGSDFITLTLLQETPGWAVVSLLGLIVFYVAYSGIEGVSKCSEVIGPLAFVILTIFIVMLLKDADYHQLLPLFADSGLVHIVRGAKYMVGFLGEVVVLILFTPFLTKKGIIKETLTGVSLAVLFLTLFMVVVLMVFGPHLSARMWYPAYGAVRMISLGGFFERIDPIAVMIWLYFVIIKLAVFTFAGTYSLSQWLNIKNWRRLLWVVVIVECACSFIPKNVIHVNVEFGDQFWFPYMLSISIVGVPMLVWAVAAVRKRKNA